MGFKKLETKIPDLYIIEPDVFGDARGYFKETWSKKAFAAIGLELEFDQDNLSFSGKGVVRGLHFQNPPHAQGKLVSALRGKVLDVVVDIRKGSPTYGQHEAVELSEENHRMLWVPKGFAHGFSVLSENALFYYKCVGFYNQEAEGGLSWNDPALGIDWQVKSPIISEKDQHNPVLSELDSPFTYSN